MKLKKTKYLLIIYFLNLYCSRGGNNSEANLPNILPGFNIYYSSLLNEEKGDLIVFSKNQSLYTFRIVGIGGEFIKFKQIKLSSINMFNEKLKEKYLVCEKWEDDLYINQLLYKTTSEEDWKSYLYNIPLDYSTDKIKEAFTKVCDNKKARNNIIFEEIYNNKSVYIIEYSGYFPDHKILCPEIYTKGCKIPKDTFFVLGDNRGDSMDSRYIGYIEKKEIKGVVFEITASIKSILGNFR